MQVPKATQEERDEKPKRDVVPEGEYLVFVGSVKAKSLPDGTEEWNVQLEVMDGPSKGRWLFDTLTWNKEWRWKQIQVLEALGFDLSKDQAILPDHLNSKPALVKVKHNKKGDKTYANVRGWEPAEAGEEEPF